MVDDPDEGMRLWWQELTRKTWKEFNQEQKEERDDRSEERKLSKKEENADAKKKSKFARVLKANIRQSTTMNKNIKVKAKLMDTDVSNSKTPRNGTVLWLETLEKANCQLPKHHQY